MKVKFIEPQMVKIIHQKLDNVMTIEMVHLPKGRFMMGEGSEQREVIIDYEFEIGKYPVTFEEYDMFCEDTNRDKPNDENWGRDRRPVINVSWYDAVAFCEWLSEKSNQNYRLPTEIEWEYACRAGTTTKWSFGDDENELDKYAWYYNNSNETTHLVGEKKPNNWGLHDMHGNVFEWCEGGQNKDYNWELIRGGSWSFQDSLSRSAYRYSRKSDIPNIDGGFRILRDIDIYVKDLTIEDYKIDKNKKDNNSQKSLFTLKKRYVQLKDKIDELDTFFTNINPYAEMEYTYNIEDFSDEDDFPGNRYLISAEFDREHLDDLRNEIENDIEEATSILENKSLEDNQAFVDGLLEKQYKIESKHINEPLGIDKDCEESYLWDDGKLLYIVPKEEVDYSFEEFNEVSKDITFNCEECSTPHGVDCDELDWEAVSSDERSMGRETNYEAIYEEICETCSSNMSITFNCWEYPVGAENSREVSVNGVVNLEGDCCLDL